MVLKVKTAAAFCAVAVPFLYDNRLEVVVVKAVVEVLGLSRRQRVMVFLACRAVLKAALLAVLTAFATLRTRTAFGARTALTLNVSLGFWYEYAVGQFVLARLRVDFHQLDGNLVALFQAGFLNGFKPLPVDFRYVQKSVLAGKYLHEAAVRHD